MVSWLYQFLQIQQDSWLPDLVCEFVHTPYSACTFPLFILLFSGKYFSIQTYWNLWKLLIQTDIKGAVMTESILHLSSRFACFFLNFKNNWLIKFHKTVLQFRVVLSEYLVDFLSSLLTQLPRFLSCFPLLHDSKQFLQDLDVNILQILLTFFLDVSYF